VESLAAQPPQPIRSYPPMMMSQWLLDDSQPSIALPVVE
jgi:hypothetical protein